ncbi:DUF6153 family protein [Streptomyces sp. Da 82-17]|uniref:DUF6153 family protein n=1 Tax=Streptomyces sp. Da 82-17 TaxID=3377116 RepID=UPI0038D4195F
MKHEQLQARTRPPVRFRGLLLMLGVLLGLVGMHGLGPAPHAAASGHHRAASHASATARTAPHPSLSDQSLPGRSVSGESVSGQCDHSGEGCGGGHVRHSDPTCSSPGVAGSPALPALLPSLTDGAEPPAVHPVWAGDGPVGGRAPPSLSELQLLRI